MHPKGRRGVIGVEVDFLDEPVSEAPVYHQAVLTPRSHAVRWILSYSRKGSRQQRECQQMLAACPGGPSYTFILQE